VCVCVTQSKHTLIYVSLVLPTRSGSNKLHEVVSSPKGTFNQFSHS
jgi:hypothetical protein